MFAERGLGNPSRTAVAETPDGDCLPLEPVTRTVTVPQEPGLHLRPCSAIVSVVEWHQATVMVRKGRQSVSGDSILGLLSLEAPPGTELELSASGEEAQEVLDALAALFDSGFEE